MCPPGWGVYRLYKSIIDVSAQTCRPTGWGLTPWTTEEKNTNMFLWCSQQGIRRLLLTGLKQYIPSLCPSTPHVLFRDGVFLSFPSWSFSLQSLSHSYYWMFNLGFGSFPSSGGIMSILSNPEIPHQSYMPELLSFRKKRILPPPPPKKRRGGGGCQSFQFKWNGTNGGWPAWAQCRICDRQVLSVRGGRIHLKN